MNIMPYSSENEPIFEHSLNYWKDFFQESSNDYSFEITQVFKARKGNEEEIIQASMALSKASSLTIDVVDNDLPNTKPVIGALTKEWYQIFAHRCIVFNSDQEDTLPLIMLDVDVILNVRAEILQQLKGKAIPVDKNGYAYNFDEDDMTPIKNLRTLMY